VAAVGHGGCACQAQDLHESLVDQDQMT